MFTDHLHKVVHKVNYVSQKVKDGELPDLIRHHRRRWLLNRLLAGKTGLEVGGPSRTFTAIGEVPAYMYAKRVDNTNFAQQTVWEGTIAEGMTFHYDDAKAPGRQYIHDAGDLHSIPTGTYDFLLSSHTLEHVANPLKVLDEWKRVLTAEGALMMVLPHPSKTFDHKRPTTPLAHLIDDYNQNVGEDDLTHCEEIIQNHDLSLDKHVENLEAFRQRSLDNFKHRCLHHHVFDTRSAVAMIDHAGFQVLNVEAKLPMHIIVIARKVLANSKPDNRQFLDPSAKYLRISPFERDHEVAAALNAKASIVQPGKAPVAAGR